MWDIEESTELITFDELCETLMIGRNTAYNLLRDGSLKAFKIGRVWKIPKKAVSEFIKTNAILEIR